ncbi:acyl-CoA N-acyltransferase, partial [Lentinula edodes]
MLSTHKDDNFCYPIPDVLETTKLRLVPFVPSLHASIIAQSTDKATWHYLPFGPFPTAEALVEDFYEARIHRNRGDTLFVGYDKTQTQTQTRTRTQEEAEGQGGQEGDNNNEGTPAGICGYVYTNPSDLYTELFVLAFPRYHHTHVASHMIGLLMQYALNLPGASPSGAGGLGLRRVQWSANVKNQGSVGLAKKMGFRVEGIRRWARVLEVDKGEGGNGVERREGDPRGECPGRDTLGLAICWDEWEEGGRERVEGIL